MFLVPALALYKAQHSDNAITEIDTFVRDLVDLVHTYPQTTPEIPISEQRFHVKQLLLDPNQLQTLNEHLVTVHNITLQRIGEYSVQVVSTPPLLETTNTEEPLVDCLSEQKTEPTSSSSPPLTELQRRVQAYEQALLAWKQDHMDKTSFTSNDIIPYQHKIAQLNGKGHLAFGRLTDQSAIWEGVVNRFKSVHHLHLTRVHTHVSIQRYGLRPFLSFKDLWKADGTVDVEVGTLLCGTAFQRWIKDHPGEVACPLSQVCSYLYDAAMQCDMETSICDSIISQLLAPLTHYLYVHEGVAFSRVFTSRYSSTAIRYKLCPVSLPSSSSSLIISPTLLPTTHTDTHVPSLSLSTRSPPSGVDPTSLIECWGICIEEMLKEPTAASREYEIGTLHDLLSAKFPDHDPYTIDQSHQNCRLFWKRQQFRIKEYLEQIYGILLTSRRLKESSPMRLYAFKKRNKRPLEEGGFVTKNLPKLQKMDDSVEIAPIPLPCPPPLPLPSVSSPTFVDLYTSISPYVQALPVLLKQQQETHIQIHKTVGHILECISTLFSKTEQQKR